MLFQSSVRAELARAFGASLVVLFTIVVTIMLIRTLGLAASGSVNPKEVMLVLGYTVLGRVHIVLTMALFVAVMSVVARMHRDSEMVIWQGAGVGLLGLLGPVMRFAWPVLATMAVLLMLVWPWANQQANELRERFSQRSDLQRVQPGQFQTNARGDRVFFIDKHSDATTTGHNVLISGRLRGGESTITARSASLLAREDQQLLRFEMGQRFDVLGAEGWRVSRFERYETVVADTAWTPDARRDMKSRPTWELLRDPDPGARGELAWRIGLLLTAVNLIVLALAAGASNPRAGMAINIVFALFAFLAYTNILAVGTNWIATGRVGFWAWTLGFHGAVLVLVGAALYKRHRGWSLRAWLRQRFAAQQPAFQEAA